MPKTIDGAQKYPRETCIDCGLLCRAYRHHDGRGYCFRCAGVNPIFFRPCPRCGESAYLNRNLCISCRAHESVHLLFTDEVTASDRRILAMRDACLAADPIAVQSVFNRPKIVAQLRMALTAPTGFPSHQDLDAAGTDMATRTVRSFLVQYGILPSRDDHLARLEQWVTETMMTIKESEERHALTGYARWAHLRRLREQTAPTRFAQISSIRREIRMILELLARARDQGHSLVELTQLDLDSWAAAGPQDCYRVHNFLRWAAANGNCRRLSFEKRPASLPLATASDEDAQWDALRTIFDGSINLKPSTRLAAALILLYGASVSKIVQLTVDDITPDGEILFVRLGRVPLALPHSVGQFALQTKENRRSGLIFQAAEEAYWLFPGVISRNHLSVAALRERLYALNISPRRARSHALTTLAQEMPAAVLARLTGLHISTASRWMLAVSAPNARYAATTHQLDVHT